VSRPGAPRPENVTGAVYGQILVTTIVATLSEDHGISAGELLFWVVVTMLVFWIAHVYAEGVARRLERDRDLGLQELRELAVDELPELQACLPAVAALALGWLGVLSREAAVDLAIGLGVAVLAAWGFVIARRSGLSPARTLGAVLITGGFGLAIVGLKVLIG
jgi:hypothetical protein